MDERARQSRSRAFAGLFTSRPSISCLLPPLLIRQVNSRMRDTHDRLHSTRFSRTPPLRKKTFHAQGLHASETSGVFRSRAVPDLVPKFVYNFPDRILNDANLILFKIKCESRHLSYLTVETNIYFKLPTNI